MSIKNIRNIRPGREIDDRETYFLNKSLVDERFNQNNQKRVSDPFFLMSFL